jgi:hypothetical protein
MKEAKKHMKDGESLSDKEGEKQEVSCESPPDLKCMIFFPLD